MFLIIKNNVLNKKIENVLIIVIINKLIMFWINVSKFEYLIKMF